MLSYGKKSKTLSQHLVTKIETKAIEGASVLPLDMELFMIYKISPHPSLPKRGREKVEMTHSITRRAQRRILQSGKYGGQKRPYGFISIISEEAPE